ncbi:KpsF/GutQ family sugar-phosphate isomerase [Fulvivirgaceae bacterium BMA12]|uniref:KpsF/GutQ family sugar-phosphate isomerase n=1 Tax=Agaribacillus aureus TaxID=3051825 RepID=A0ABT8LJ39_9BACT|nr:KpsF/GutQ family sugar-phosphate isomerase [Fulvivirgaceae bacterium BMA12]
MKLAKNIKNTAKEVLINEAEAIEKLADYLNEDFESCVEEILSCRGRVVITGIGKSAIVASKIVATLNSTGTPALFMHAADAIHGDLGMVQENDIVICISKSGNTAEVKVLVPLLKRTGVKLIALVSNVDSFLAQHADFVLNATIDIEACPNNLAPTTSTTAHMALGDALAVCLLESRGFSNEDFARYHPGGSLGKKLYLKVNDIYPGNQLPLVKDDASVKEVIMEISGKRLGATAVVNAEKKLIGIITDGDLRRMLEKSTEIGNMSARDIMTQNPVTIQEDDYAVKALNIMQQKNITQLIVAGREQVIGFVHLHDILKEGIV